MREALRLRVGGLTLAVHAPRPSSALEPPAALAPFLARRGGDIRLDLTEEEPPVPDASSLLFESGSVWRVHRHDGGLLYRFRAPRLRPATYKAIAIDRSLRRGRLYFPPRRGRRHRYALAHPAEELLFQHRLALDGALEVHGCGVVVDGRALVFCGVSGAGKSTTARLWRRARPDALVLSDDRIVLRQRGGRPWAFGTPWHGSARYASPRAYPLGAVFLIRHGRSNRVASLPPAQAAAGLLARGFPPPWEPRGVRAALRLCHEVAEAVPVRSFAFRPEASACAAVLACLR
ncbi:MAG TPA: hypothetical protein VII13_09120 [Vicinamibacteria bacterium]